MRLWWYNNVERRWHNFCFRHTATYKAWIAEGRDPALFPRAGKITPEAIAWARKVVADRDNQQTSGEK